MIDRRGAANHRARAGPPRLRPSWVPLLLLFIVGSVGLAGCGADDAAEFLEGSLDPEGTSEEGILQARPSTQAPRRGTSTGLETFGGRAAPHGYLYVPESYSTRRPAPLVVALPGGGRNVSGAVQRIVPYADCSGALILGLLPQGPTWDYLLGGYGPDVRFIDRALARTFRRFAIDPRRVGVKGFSNGATYALALGITNGDLFRHVIAHSPGSLGVENPHGSPSFFITHGTEDRTLPIDETSRQIVPELRERGYQVTYREFSGGHDIPRGLEQDGLSWLGCPG